VKVLSVRTLDDALRALRDADPDARILAGGTDLMVEMETGRTRPPLLIDVWKVDALRGVRVASNALETNTLEIGALTTCAELAKHEEVRARADVLAEAARWVGATQIQNRATIGGNLGTASPAADLNPALFALGARVRLASTRGTRESAVEDFVTGYRRTSRAPDELVTAVIVPARPRDERRAWRKVGTRKAQSISKVVVAACVEVQGRTLRTVRAAAGSVADRTVMLPTLRDAIGLDVVRDLEAWTRVVERCVERDVSPRDDVRSTAEYRTRVLARLLTRMLHDLSTAR